MGNDTKAWISDTDPTTSREKVYSGGDVEVHANSEANFETVVVGLSAGRYGGAGSVDVLNLRNTTRSFISEMDVDTTGDLSVLAADNVDLIQYSGNVAAGQFGGGLTVQVTINTNVAEARLFNTNTNASGDTLVKATSQADSEALIASGFVGLGGAAGSFGFYISNTETRAVIEEDDVGNVTVNEDPAFASANQSVTVYAKDDVVVNSAAGGAVVGGGGVGGSLMWQDVQNTVDAHIGSGATVTAGDFVLVDADSFKDMSNSAIGLAATLGGGFAGSFIVSSIGSGTAADKTSDVDADTVNDIQAATSAVNLENYDTSTAPSSAIDKTNAATITFDVHGTVDRSVEDVGAYIDEFAEITAGGNISVEASEDVIYDGKAGAVAAGVASAVGGAASFLTIETQTEAFVHDGVVLNAGGDVLVNAWADESADVDALAAAAPAAWSIGVQVMDVDIESSQRALLGTGTASNLIVDDHLQVESADNIVVNAKHTREVDAYGLTATGGAAIAAGFSGANIDLDGNVVASIGDQAVLGQVDNDGNVTVEVGSVEVKAESYVTNTEATVPAIGAGVGAALTGALADIAITPNVDALVGDDVNIYSSDEISVEATTDHNARTLANGTAVAVGASVGISHATAKLSPAIEAQVGSGALLVADSISVNAYQNVLGSDGDSSTSRVRSEATGTSGALLIGSVGATSEVFNNAAITTTIEDATLSAASGDVTITAQSRSKATADTDADGGGIIGIGEQQANIEVATVTTVDIQDDANISSAASNLVVLSDSQEDLTTNVLAGNGGVIAVSNAQSDIDVSPKTFISVGDNVELTAAETISIEANVDGNFDNDAESKVRAGLAFPKALSRITFPAQNSDVNLVQTQIGAATLNANDISTSRHR